MLARSGSAQGRRSTSFPVTRVDEDGLCLLELRALLRAAGLSKTGDRAWRQQLQDVVHAAKKQFDDSRRSCFFGGPSSEQVLPLYLADKLDKSPSRSCRMWSRSVTSGSASCSDTWCLRVMNLVRVRVAQQVCSESLDRCSILVKYCSPIESLAVHLLRNSWAINHLNIQHGGSKRGGALISSSTNDNPITNAHCFDWEDQYVI